MKRPCRGHEGEGGGFGGEDVLQHSAGAFIHGSCMFMHRLHRTTSASTAKEMNRPEWLLVAVGLSCQPGLILLTLTWKSGLSMPPASCTASTRVLEGSTEPPPARLRPAGGTEEKVQAGRWVEFFSACGKVGGVRLKRAVESGKNNKRD